MFSIASASIYISTHSTQVSNFSTTLSTLDFFYNSYPNGLEVISHCIFYLYFFND